MNKSHFFAKQQKLVLREGGALYPDEEDAANRNVKSMALIMGGILTCLIERLPELHRRYVCFFLEQSTERLRVLESESKSNFAH